jgi:hypothetical protein
MDISEQRTMWEKIWAFLCGLPERKALHAALFVWILFALIVCGIVAVQPDRRTVTHEYRQASTKWWASAPNVYPKKNGFLYLPQAAIIYTPYNLLPSRIGEPLWRLTMLSALAGALFLACKKLSTERTGRLFLVATVLVIPSALASARNGQVNMPLAALYLFSALALSEKRWGMAAFLLTVSLALKPISLAPLLLVAAVYPAARLPLVGGLLLLFVAPFLHPSPSYVWDQYQDFVRCFLQAGRPSGHTWCDLAGLMRTFGIPAGDSLLWAIRAGAALVTLWFCSRAVRIREPFRAAFTVLLLAATYLMLFNPRTETNSYIIVGIFIAIMGAYEGIIRQDRRLAAVFCLLAFVFGSENYGWPIFPLTNLWLKAFCAILLFGWLLKSLQQRPQESPVLKPTSVPAQ